MTDQQRFIARSNVEHYRVLLLGALDAQTRKTVETLLQAAELELGQRPGRHAEA